MASHETHEPVGLSDWLRFNERQHTPDIAHHDVIEWEQPDTVEVVVMEEGDE